MSSLYKCIERTPYGNFTVGNTYDFLLDCNGVYFAQDDSGAPYHFNLHAMVTFFEKSTDNIRSIYYNNPVAPIPVPNGFLGTPQSTIKDPDIKAPQMEPKIVAELVAERTPYDDYMERFCLDEY